MTRVLICDDHPVVRQGLVALLQSLDGFEVVGVATNGVEAVKEAVLQRPDVVLMDLQMPGGDGFTALRELARVAPDVAVCVLTMFDDDDSLFAAMRAGARGYLLKGAEQEEIERAVRGLAAGEVVFGQGVAARVLGQLTAPVAGVPFPELTPRERGILDLLAAGVAGATIAQQLQLSPKTVSNNISNILTKLQVSDRSQAVVAAREAGMGH
jgi:DNA-binding NarL/FixJ family response regulator